MAVIKFRHTCDTCKEVANKLTVLRDNERPRVGDLSVCSRCETLGRFEHRGRLNVLVALAPAEIERIKIDDPEVFDEMLKGLEDFREKKLDMDDFLTMLTKSSPIQADCLSTARFFKLMNKRKYIVICGNCKEIEGQYSYIGYSPKPICKERTNANTKAD